MSNKDAYTKEKLGRGITKNQVGLAATLSRLIQLNQRRIQQGRVIRQGWGFVDVASKINLENTSIGGWVFL